MQPNDDIGVLIQKVRIHRVLAIGTDVFVQIIENTENPDPTTITISNQPKGNEKRAADFVGQSLKKLGLRCVILFVVD